MSTFSKIKGFFSRHRNKFIVGGVILGGSLLLTRYASYKLKEWQEREMVEFLERGRRQQHFESIGRTSNQTLLNLNNALNEAISEIVNTEVIVESLKVNPENKIELWNSLKVLVFTKSCLTIYSTVMFVVTLKLQLSIIGGYLYKDSKSLSTELQEKYLGTCQDFLNGGLKSLAQVIDKECKKIMDTVDLKRQLKLSDLESLFWSIQIAITTNSNCPVEKMRQYIIPNIPNVNGTYEKIIRDTIDLLDSDEIKSLVTHYVNRGFLLLVEQISELYSSNGTSSLENTSYEMAKPLAKLLPIINGLFIKKSFPDKFLQELINNDKLQALSANIYESYL